MAGSAFKDPEVVKTLSSFAPILVSDKDSAYAELSKRYSIPGFPTVIFAKSDGTELERVSGAVPPDAFNEIASKALAASK